MFSEGVEHVIEKSDSSVYRNYLTASVLGSVIRRARRAFELDIPTIKGKCQANFRFVGVSHYRRSPHDKISAQWRNATLPNLTNQQCLNQW